MEQEYTELAEAQKEYLQELIKNWLNAYKRDDVVRSANEISGLYDGVCIMAEVTGIDPTTLYSLLDDTL